MVIEESQGLHTHLNLIIDFTGSFARIFSTISLGIWLFLQRVVVVDEIVLFGGLIPTETRGRSLR